MSRSDRNSRDKVPATATSGQNPHLTGTSILTRYTGVTKPTHCHLYSLTARPAKAAAVAPTTRIR